MLSPPPLLRYQKWLQSPCGADEQPVPHLETLIDLREKSGRDSDYLGRLTEVEQHEVEDRDLHDVIFQDIELSWWKM